jgi:hypothetical protein
MVALWALLVWNGGIVLYRNDGTRLPPGTIKYALLGEPFRTIVRKIGDVRVQRLRSFLYAVFMQKRFLDEFVEDKPITLRSFGYACKGVALAMSKGYYYVNNSGKQPWVPVQETMDDTNEKDNMSDGDKAGIKRGHDNDGKEGL